MKITSKWVVKGSCDLLLEFRNTLSVSRERYVVP